MKVKMGKLIEAESPSNSDELRNAIDHIVYKL